MICHLQRVQVWWLSLPFQVGKACLFEDHLTVLNQLSHPWLIQEECEELILGHSQEMGLTVALFILYVLSLDVFSMI